ncbi:MAG: hypothetical protein KBD53_06350 [Candidatus Omnitrophica bacterium]|nr:hypothetical protein [Candidatus Omnitrophota bacterium]
MKYLILIFMLAGMASMASAQSLVCPAAEEGLTVIGPKSKIEISGRSKTTCRYYYREQLKSTIEVYFYQDYEKQRPCNSGIYQDADLRSWEYQVYGYVTDSDQKDFLTKGYWKKVGAVLVKQAEDFALPCVAEGQRYIRRAVDVREEK